MKTAKTLYNDLPEMVPVPKDLVHKKGEVIFIIDETNSERNKTMLKDFSGSIPDFPERGSQSSFEVREDL